MAPFYMYVFRSPGFQSGSDGGPHLTGTYMYDHQDPAECDASDNGAKGWLLATAVCLPKVLHHNGTNNHRYDPIGEVCHDVGVASSVLLSWF